MEPKVHLGGLVLDAGIGMRCGVIKELVDAKGEIGPRAGGDGRGYGADCSLHGIIDCTGIIIEYASELLTVLELCCGELTFVACMFGELLFLSVCRGSIGVWRVLWFCWMGVTEA